MFYRFKEKLYKVYFSFRQDSFEDEASELIIAIDFDSLESNFKIIKRGKIHFSLDDDTFNFDDSLNSLEDDDFDFDDSSVFKEEIIDILENDFKNILKIIDEHQGLISINSEIDTHYFTDVDDELVYFEGTRFNRSALGIFSYVDESDLNEIDSLVEKKY